MAACGRFCCKSHLKGGVGGNSGFRATETRLSRVSLAKAPGS
jgi:hypothetical protein